jgi:hypothetical protein
MEVLVTAESGAEGHFESFIKETYPFHAKRLNKARSIVRFALVKGVLSAVTFVGLPLCSAIWLATKLVVEHSASLQEGQRAIPFVEYAEPASQIALIAILILCTLVGAILGYQKKQKFGLQIERDELSLRTDFMLRELAREQVSNSGSAKVQQSYDDEFVLRNPKSQEREKAALSFPPLSRVSGNPSEGPSVTGGDFSDISLIDQPRRR